MNEPRIAQRLLETLDSDLLREIIGDIEDFGDATLWSKASLFNDIRNEAIKNAEAEIKSEDNLISKLREALKGCLPTLEDEFDEAQEKFRWSEFGIQGCRPKKARDGCFREANRRDTGTPRGRCAEGGAVSTFASIRTSFWRSDSGLHTRRDLRILKRKSDPEMFLMQDAGEIGAEEVIKNITNFGDVSDGEYRIELCNISRDFESGHIDDYSYVLVPITPSVSGKKSSLQASNSPSKDASP